MNKWIAAILVVCVVHSSNMALNCPAAARGCCCRQAESCCGESSGGRCDCGGQKKDDAAAANNISSAEPGRKCVCAQDIFFSAEAGAVKIERDGQALHSNKDVNALFCVFLC